MMAALDLHAAARLLGVAYSGEAVPLRGAAIDSRRVKNGDLFVAVRGEQVDGHDFIESAAERGAVAALVEREVDAPIPCLVVPRVLEALAQVARANREQFSGLVIAITGSCGKTSVKNICRAVFTQEGATVATEGNYNNEIGVPLTLTGLSDATRYAIVEMGATGRGDVAYLCDLAKPQISTVLNAMEAHLDGFGSVADVASVKAEIFDGLGRGGLAILNIDSPWADLWRERIQNAGVSVVAWSLSNDADVTARQVEDRGIEGSTFELTIRGESRLVRFPLPGRHNIGNALAAAGLATAAGLAIDPIACGLERAEGEAGRLRPERLADGTLLIDDSYNANPGSVRAAIDVLAGRSGRRLLILGEMLELGEDSAPMHAEMGARAAERGIDSFVGVGPALKPAVEAFGAVGHWVAVQSELEDDFPTLLADHDTILVKGSRGAAMERVIEGLRWAAGEGKPC